ncbi:hypothetical protein [Qipengyuania sp.]|uniref:hypothetical protein n=1 Tax=Qipengyuania sp. TaxID=2004515 RepID=UPI0035C7AE0F
MTGRSAIRRSCAALYTLAGLALVLRAGEPQDPAWWIGGLVFFLVVASPVVVGLWLARWLKSHVYHLFCVTVAAIAVYGFYLQWRTMFAAEPDAQSALVLLFVPFYQAAAVSLAFIVAKIADYYAKPARRSKGTP